MHARENEKYGTSEGVPVLPPIELDTVVPCTPDAAFDYFTRDIGKWWPLIRYSCSEARAAGVFFEAREGGKLIETDVDGQQYVWGTVMTWQPGKELRFSWHPGQSPEKALTVAISFQATGAMTRVRLVHSGWERLGSSAAETRTSYANGWPTVLGQLFTGYCEQSVTNANSQSKVGEQR